MNAAPPDPPDDGSRPRTPLVRPDRFFAHREFDALRLLAVLGLLVLSAPATVYGAGWVITTNLDGTVQVDNPARPPDWVCDDGPGSAIHDQRDCDEPRQVERDVDAVFWPVIEDLVGPAMGGVLLVWLLIGLGLHAGSWLAGGTGGVGASFAVAAWGMVPELLGTAVGLGVLYLTVDPVVVTPGTDPAVALEPMLDQIRAARPVLTLVTLATTAWSAVIWRYGLEHKRDIRATEAWLVAGLVAVVIALLALV